MSRPVNSVARRPLKRAPLRPMVLEPRLMFDGAAVDTASQAVEASAAAAASARSSSDATITDSHDSAHVDAVTVAPPASEIVFITTSTPDWQKLAGNVREGVEVILLDPEQDGVEQVSAALAGRTGITAVHIVSHGADGMIILGNTPLDSDGISERATELAAWKDHLTSGADILLYGCDVASSDQGRSFASLLASTTGADVAASSDTTGAAAQGGDWTLEYASGSIESNSFLTAAGVEAYDARLATISLSGATGWTAIMFGAGRDPDGDSQAGAADTDIIGDATHGSLYTAYSDSGTTSTADDFLYFRMRIDNPTSDTNFSGVAIVGMDANGDGRIDLFFSVDGRNNTRAVRLLDPGTGANLSPNTTSTSALPTGWLPNNGVYTFNPSNYSVDAVSSVNDPHYGPSTVAAPVGTTSATDLTGDGKRDVFISWRVPIADIATVLAKPSPVDRNGVYGPRGATGLAGFTKDTAVKYVSFTQTQPGPINGDLNGVGASYDKNASFAELGAFTAEMSASTPVAAATRLDITDNIAGIANGPVTFTFQFSEGVSGFDAGDITISGGTKGSFTAIDADTYTLVVTTNPGVASGNIDVSVETGAAISIAGSLPTAAGSATQAYDTQGPQLTISTPAIALSGQPTLGGTTDLPDGSLITVTIDPDNDASTLNNVVYKVMAAAGAWTLNTATTAPTAGNPPGGGLTSYSKVTATGADAAGNTTSAVELNRPTVTPQTTTDTTPAVSGTWTNIPGDTLSVTVDGTSYTPVITGNTWTVNVTNPLAASGATYEVVATVTRSSAVTDTTSGELIINDAPAATLVDITGGSTATGSDTTPIITGSSANAGGFVVVRLDPNNDGDLSDAVTYSVTPDGSGNWTLDTGSVTPISGTMPAGGFIGATGIRATDSSGSVADTQVLTISTPTVTISSVTSTATTDANAQVVNGDTWLNMTEDNSVTIAGTAATGFTVNLVVTDANGNSLEFKNLAVDGSGNWSTTGANLSSLDSTTLTMTATLAGTSVHATNTAYTHDTIAPRIFITNPSEIKKNGGVVYGGSELPNTGLTITVRDATDTTTVGTWTTTTDANGDWTVTTSGNLVSGSSGNVLIKVAPTTAPATDAARNIVGTAQITQFVAANAATTSIAIGTIAGDNTITVGEIGSGLAITGTTTLTGTGSVTVTIDDGDAGSTANVTATGTYSAGTWTVSLTKAQIQGLLNGQLTVTASAVESGGITITDVALPTLSLLTPTLTITDNVPGSANGPVTFTFQFSEGVTGFGLGDIAVTNGTAGTFTAIDADTYTLVVTPTPNASGEIGISVNSNVANGVNTGRGNGGAVASQTFNTTVAAAAPSLTIDADALATDATPLITGTTSLSAGAPIVITIDPDNDSGTANSLTYAATVQSGGTWSLDIGTATPTSGTLPSGGLTTWAWITATATNAYGNSTSVSAHDAPAVTAQLTTDNTPTVTGTWTNLGTDTLSVSITPAGGGTTTTYAVGSGLTINGNTWAFTSSTLADGDYNVVATTTRSGTGKIDVTNTELTIDTLGTVDITGGASIATGDATPVISGTSTGMPAGTLLTLQLDTDNNGSFDLAYQTTIGADGSWSIDTATATPSTGSFPAAGLDGSVPMQASATDPAGNAGLDTQILAVDVTPPQIALTSGSRSPDTTPLITGTTDLPAGGTITLVIDPDNVAGGTVYTYTAIVQADGTWQVDTGNPSANGGTGPTQTYPTGTTLGLTATATDSVGNHADASRPLAIDSSAPTVAIHAPLDWNGNPDGSLDATEDNSVVIKGSTTGLSDGQTLTISITDGTTTITDTVTVTVTGNSWAMSSINLSSLAAGTISVSATHIDSNGDSYTDTATIDHIKAATVAIDRISEDTGGVADFITRDNTIAIHGTATPGATVTVLVQDATNATVATFTVTADGSTGAWNTTATTTLAAGSYTLDASVSSTHATQAMTIVSSTPPLLTTSTPTDNATGVAVDADLTLTFDKTIHPGSGTISLYRSSDNSLVETYNITSGLGSITDGSGVSLGRLSFGSSTITLNPGTDLAIGTSYYIKIDSTAVIDEAGNAYAGIADATTLNFQTSGGANALPTLSASGGSVAFTEGADISATPVVIDSGISVADSDNATLSSAVVAITGNFAAGQDVLAFTNDGSTMGNISASFNAGTGVLSLSSSGATATLAQWQAALRAVTYTNSSDTPDTTSRTVSFTVNDGNADSNTDTRVISITASNDSPALTAPASIAVTEDIASPLTGISFADVDADSASVTATLSVGSGSLAATSGSGVTVSGTASALTLTGSVTNINAFIAASEVSFQTASNATATVTLSASIDDGGNTGSGGARTDSTTIDLLVTPQNDPPVVTTQIGTQAFIEGSGAVAIDSGLTVADIDNTTLASATVAIAGNFQVGQDVLAFINDGSTMGNISASYNTGNGVLTLSSGAATATLAQWQAALRSVTYNNAASTPNTANRTISFSVNDGSLGSLAATRTLSVTDVDLDAPVISGPSGAAGDAASAKSVAENRTAVTTLSANEPVTWSLSGGADLAKFAIDPSTGALRFNSAPDFETPTDLGATAGNNTYVVQVQAEDANGNLSTQTITVTVTDVDDTAPAISGPSGAAGDAASAKSVAENSTAVTTLSANEPVTWSLSGGADLAKFAIDPNTGALRFNSAPDFETPTDLGATAGNNTYVVQVQAEDANGNLSTQTITVTVTDVAEGSRPTQTVSIGSMTRDSGTSATDFITADGAAERTVSGTISAPLSANEVVEITFDGGSTWVRASTDGTAWHAADPNAHAGDWTIQARVTNTVVNLSGPADNRAVTLDTTAPTVPTVDALDTTSTTPTITGTAAVGDGEILRVTVGGITYTAGDGHLVLNGHIWTLNIPAEHALPFGIHAITASVTDAAGNVSTDTSTNELTVADVPPPQVVLPPIEAPVVPPAPVPLPPVAAAPAVVEAPVTPASPVHLDPIRNDPIGDNQLTNLRTFAEQTSGDAGIRTRSEGFPIVVLRAADSNNDNAASNAPSLVVNRGIPDIVIEQTGRRFEVPIPNDAFAHSRQDAVINLTIARTDGRPLPGWLQFDPRMGVFRGTAPDSFSGDVEIRVIARDQNGNQVEVVFRIRVGEDGKVIRSGAADSARSQPAQAARLEGRAGLSAQLRLAGRGAQTTERDRLIEQARQLPARKAPAVTS
jgi:large repetitive protein